MIPIVAAVVLCILLPIVLLNGFGSSSDRSASQNSASEPAREDSPQANPQPANPPPVFRDAVNDAIVQAQRESERAVQEKKAREAAQAQAETWQAKKARIAELEKRSQAIDAAEAKRVAAQKETEAKRAAVQREASYEAWKTRRKAEMEQSAAHLRPEQVATWNRAMAAWNKLTPAQREAAFRQEYQRRGGDANGGAFSGLQDGSRGGADLTRSSISDADWQRAAQAPSMNPGLPSPNYSTAATPAPIVPIIPGLDPTPDPPRVAAPPPAPAPAQPTSGLAASVSAPPPSSAADDSAVGVPMIREEGVLKLPVQINGAIQLMFIVDSGAGDVQIPEDVFLTLTRTGTIQQSDIRSDATYIDATGKQTRHPRFMLRSLRVGNVTLTGVRANVGDANSPLLLGQSFLSRFKEWKIDNQSGTLSLKQ